eukprot:1347106-Amorphochlora_amoeboformis.AAC.1
MEVENKERETILEREGREFWRERRERERRERVRREREGDGIVWVDRELKQKQPTLRYYHSWVESVSPYKKEEGVIS